MRIDLNQANNQVRQLRSLAENLREARTVSRSCQKNLNQNWVGREMVAISNSVERVMGQLLSAASELDAIAVDVAAAAQEVRRQEELSAATAALDRADANVISLRRTFENAQRQHTSNPTPATQSELDAAQRNLNSATNTRNDAAAAVHALNR